ncbi:ABC transporter substrate-binding protein [Acidisoma sp. 7E03]
MTTPILRRWLGACLGTLALLALARPAAADPITVTDMAGRTVTLAAPPTRIALQDGRIALDLALLDRADPFGRVVIWNNLLRRQLGDLWPLLAQRWPKAAQIPDMGFDDNGAVNLESLIAQKPQLLIAELRARPVLEQDGAMRTLASLHVPVIFVDDAEHPVPNAVRSLTLLGRVLGRETEASAYDAFYQAHLDHLQQVIAAQPQPHPTVFVEALAGRADAGGCCFTHGDFGWGLLVQAVGGRNLGSSLLKTPSGDVSVEALIAAQPDVVVMTGRGPGGAMLGFGYGANAPAIGRTFTSLEARTGLSALHAVQQRRVYGLYHPFYSSVFNIVALEYLAKFIYPQAFADLDPGATYRSLVAQFTEIPAAPAILGQQAPAHGG